MTIRVHRLKRLGDNSIELWIHGMRDSDAEYVANLLKHIPHAAVSDPYTRTGTEGVFTYVNVRSTASDPITPRSILAQIGGDPEIEIMALHISQSEEPRAVNVHIQERLFVQIQHIGDGMFSYGESDNGISTSGAHTTPTPMEIQILGRNDVRQRLLDIGMDGSVIDTNLNWLDQDNAT